MRPILVALLSASLVTSPVVAATQAPSSADSLSLTQARAGAEMEGANQLDSYVWIGVGVLAVILLFVLLDDGDDDEDSESP